MHQGIHLRETHEYKTAASLAFLFIPLHFDSWVGSAGTSAEYQLAQPSYQNASSQNSSRTTAPEVPSRHSTLPICAFSGDESSGVRTKKQLRNHAPISGYLT